MKKKLFQIELASFCEHFSHPKMRTPSSKRKSLLKDFQKNYLIKYETKKTYYEKPRNNSKGNLSYKKNIIPSISPPSQTQAITGYKCCSVGHKVNKSPLKVKLCNLKIKSFKRQHCPF